MSRYFSPRRLQEAARVQASGAIVRPCVCGHSDHDHMVGRLECHNYDVKGARCACQKWIKP